MELKQGNISTIATYIYWICEPIFIKFGYDIDQVIFVSILTGIIGLIITLWSSTNPNTLKILGNQKEDETETLRKDYTIQDTLNDEYTTEFGDETDGC